MSDVYRTTDLALLVFEGSHVRYRVDAQGLPWWVAQDVCTILGLDNVSRACARLDADEKDDLTFLDVIGRQQAFLVLNEPGLYRLLFRSNKPEAKRFTRWVTHELLPTLRRTGAYQVGPQLPAPRVRVREHAEVSTHLLAVWRVLREATELVSNHEVAHRAGVAPRTARAHTKYLLDLGLLDVYETFPRHLYGMAEQADKRHAAYYQRLEQISAIIATRQIF